MRLILAIALLCLVCGCAATCKVPMRMVGGVCCIDANDNKVCDKDEANGTSIDCEPPYRVNNMTCCLDTNGNNICDDAEAKNNAPTAVIVTTKKTTTTTIQAQNATSDSTTSTTATSTSSTTTMDRWAPTTTMPVCYDSDGGETVGVNGIASGLNKLPPHERVNVTDYCKSSQMLVEYRCGGEYIYSRDILCESFHVCSDGRCCLPNDVKCSNSKECCSGICIRKQMVSLCY